MYSRSKKEKKNTPNNFNTNYNQHGLMSASFCFINFLGVRLHGGSLPNFNFLNVNPQILQ